MRNKASLPVQTPRERAFLVGVEMPAESGVLSMDESLTELALLAQTAGLDVVGETGQRLRRVESKTLIGTGKVAEVRALAERWRDLTERTIAGFTGGDPCITESLDADLLEYVTRAQQG